jgi:tryptophanyl-tRNA synthetase
MEIAMHNLQAPLPQTARPVALTGDRPTGPLHLGHYAGSLQARVRLQHLAEQYVLIADVQALSDHAASYAMVSDNVLEVALDYLCAGIDPGLTTICVQSQLPALAELAQLLQNYVSVGRLERNPTVREEIRQRGFERSIPAGFLMYPVSQVADIAAFKATLVPVGDDQLPMVELANEIVQRFNRTVGRDVLCRSEPLLSKVSRLPGIDGRAKMSKSLGNAIALNASQDAIRKAVNAMYTDARHLRVEDPGRVEGNVVFAFLDAFDPDVAAVQELKERYRQGGVADSTLKRRLDALLQGLVAPMRAERERYGRDRGEVLSMLKHGTALARERTAATVAQVKQALKFDYFDRAA